MLTHLISSIKIDLPEGVEDSGGLGTEGFAPGTEVVDWPYKTGAWEAPRIGILVEDGRPDVGVEETNGASSLSTNSTE
jgi:hypothetical protein